MPGDLKKVIRVGSRKSQLALVQTETVIDFLNKKYPQVEFEIDKALSKIGDKSVFTKELEVALLDGRVDFVVHSLKDVPTELAPGLAIGAICKRDDLHDAVIIKKGLEATGLAALPPGSVVGTSSMRRSSQLRMLYPQLNVQDVRGNLNTRLSKLDEEGGPYQALVLASAGLQRLGWQHRITETLDASEVMYAVGQGAMCVECRSDDQDTLRLLSPLNHAPSLLVCLAERSFLKRLEGGCSVPVATFCEIRDDQLILKGGVFSVDGSKVISDSRHCKLEGWSAEERRQAMEAGDEEHLIPITAILVAGVTSRFQRAAEDVGIRLADKLKENGASQLLKQARQLAAEEAASKQAGSK